MLRALGTESTKTSDPGRKPPEPLTGRDLHPRTSHYTRPEWAYLPFAAKSESPGLLAQRCVGNQAVLGMQHSASAETAGGAPGSAAGFLQRKCACGGECAECKKKEGAALHRSPRGSGSKAGVPASVRETIRSSGQKLDPGVRTFMESRFGKDFSSVKVHADTSAAHSAEAVSALAYTVGDHVVFGRGQYAPATPAGRGLIAHELAHVVQQRGFDGMPARVSDPHEPLEREADRAATALMDSRHPAVNVSHGGGTLSRRVAGVNCPANQFGAPDNPRADLETADGIAIPLANQTAANLLTDSQTVQGGIPAAPSATLQAFEDHFGLPVAAGRGFMNRLTGTIRPTQEIALSEELATVSRRFAGVARLMTQGLSYNCPGNRPLNLIGCLPGNCTQGDAFSCPGNSLVALCSTFWANFDDNARAQILIHESLHITLGNIGVGSILDATTRGPGRNFNIAGCYEALLSDLTGADSQAECPDVP